MCGASCVGLVEKALKAVPGVTEATVNLATERAHVRGSTDPGALVAAIAAAGYAAQSIDSDKPADDEAANVRKDAERVALKRDLIVAAVLTLPGGGRERGEKRRKGGKE